MHKFIKHCKIKNPNVIISKRSIESSGKSNSNLIVPTKNIRNIGIIAHIDAGKTTCTERLLYLTGMTSSVGDVDDGNTVTDFMDLERERGITIQSAAITSFWKDHRINLIDTPGHVDFTLEVERCLRVLDGAVTVLDASAGVQAQTLTVWKQAKKFRLPCVFFINKMDKIGADHIKSMESIENKLGQRVCALIVPVFTDSKFTGLINLLERKSLDLTNPKANWIPIAQNQKFSDELLAGREELFSRIGDVNETFANSLLSAKDLYNFPVDSAIAALRKSALERSLAPVSIGTALRHTRSVEPALDMIVNFLPSPAEKDYHLPDSEFYALVFKIVHDKKRGQLSYMRVYKGELQQGSSLHNLNRGTIESGIKLFTPFSDDFQPANKVTEGNIAVVSGLSSTITGDTLVRSKETAKASKSKPVQTAASIDHHVNVLEGIESPDPVFFCSIEPPTTSSIHVFERALNELAIEDPSLRVRYDNETGQTILEGMGELHIEIVKERLLREYGLKVFMGALQVGYREVTNSSASHTSEVQDVYGDQKFKQSCSLTMEVEPTEKPEKFTDIRVQIAEEEAGAQVSTDVIRSDWRKAINEGCKNSLYNGPVLGFPVHNVRVTLKNLVVSGGRVNPALLSACASECVTEALKKAGTHLIEPIMLAEIDVVDEAADQGVHNVLHELNQRRATILNVTPVDTKGHHIVIEAHVPLAETPGLSNAVRSLSHGLGTLHLQFHEYKHVSPQDQALLIEKYYHRIAAH